MYFYAGFDEKKRFVLRPIADRFSSQLCEFSDVFEPDDRINLNHKKHYYPFDAIFFGSKMYLITGSDKDSPIGFDGVDFQKIEANGKLLFRLNGFDPIGDNNTLQARSVCLADFVRAGVFGYSNIYFGVSCSLLMISHFDSCAFLSEVFV